jgi:hypothetical protein
MTDSRSISTSPLVSRAMGYALAILILTSVHHAYGAYIYGTPWRLHIVPIAALAATLIVGARVVLRRASPGVASTLAFWVFSAVTLIFPVVVIGLFEGGYNHAVKDVLYFGGAPMDVMRALFPPPAYELPNDVLFEVTGVLQFAIAVVAGYHVYSLLRAWWGGRSTPRPVNVPV